MHKSRKLYVQQFLTQIAYWNFIVLKVRQRATDSFYKQQSIFCFVELFLQTAPRIHTLKGTVD
jgi:hypothetical protein